MCFDTLFANLMARLGRPPDKFNALTHEVAYLRRLVEDLMASAADLTAAVAALTNKIASLPPVVDPPVPLITQPELDAATQGVVDATAAMDNRFPPQ